MLKYLSHSHCDYEAFSNDLLVWSVSVYTFPISARVVIALIDVDSAIRSIKAFVAITSVTVLGGNATTVWAARIICAMISLSAMGSWNILKVKMSFHDQISTKYFYSHLSSPQGMCKCSLIRTARSRFLRFCRDCWCKGCLSLQFHKRKLGNRWDKYTWT